MNHQSKPDAVMAAVSLKPYSDVRDYVDQLESQTDCLRHALQILGDRLEPVITPEQLATDGACKEADGPSSPLAKQLCNILRANNGTLAALNDLINRLQV